MQVLDIIESAQSGEAMANLARQFGITEEEARAAAKAVLPELAHAIERNTLSRGGLADLVHALGQGHHEAILEAPQYWRDARIVADGDAVAARILGSEARVDALSARAARFSGLGEGVIKMLLPILAQMLMGAISRYAKSGLGDILSKLPGGMSGSGNGGRPRSREFETGGTMGDGRGFELPKVDLPTGGYPLPPIPGASGETSAPIPRSPAARQPGEFDLPLPREERGSGSGFELPRADLPPAGGYPLPPMPPSSDDTQGLPRRRPYDTPSAEPLPFPLPGPGGNRGGDNPYGDLSDILRRGGRLPDGAAAGGGLWSIVRSILGSALGFGNRGILGWLIQLVVMRWGWTILRRILTGR